MSIVVPDASILLKWVLPAENETHVDKALLLAERFVAGEINLLVPSLWLFEVANIVCLKNREAAQNLISILTSMQIPVADVSDSWIQKAIELSNTYQVTFYDASYHALAIIHGGVFVTADKTYLRKVKNHPHATRLADWA